MTEAEMRAELNRLREDCAQAYQAVGAMADELGYWGGASDHDKEQMTKLLDNLDAAAGGRPRPHHDLLPFRLTTADHPVAKDS